MEKTLKILEELGFYTYEEPDLIPIIQTLQIEHNSIWLMDGRYESTKATFAPKNNEIVEIIGEDLYIYQPLPAYRCLTVDKEDLYECLPTILENQQLNSSLRKCGVQIDELDEYEDSSGNLHLVTNLGTFLISPAKFRSSSSGSVYLNWQVITFKVLSMLNNLLFRADSLEKFYVLREEDQERISLALLTPTLFEFLQNTEELESQYLAKPIEKYFESLSSQNF